MSVSTSSSASSSCAALTVTVCAVAQSDVVKVRLVLPGVRPVPVCPEIVTVTVSEGSVASDTS